MCVRKYKDCRLYLDSSYYIIIDKIPLGVLICALRDVVISLPLAILGTWISGIIGMVIGLMLAQPIGYLIAVGYVRLRYGKDNYPLFIADKENSKSSLFYELSKNPEKIISVRDNIEKVLLLFFNLGLARKTCGHFPRHFADLCFDKDIAS